MSSSSEWQCIDCTMFNSSARTTCEICGGTRPGGSVSKSKIGSSGGAVPAASASVACPACGGSHDVANCPYTVKDDVKSTAGKSDKADGKDAKGGAGPAGGGGKNDRIPPPIDRPIVVTFSLSDAAPNATATATAGAAVASAVAPIATTGATTATAAVTGTTPPATASAATASATPATDSATTAAGTSAGAAASASGATAAAAPPALKPESISLLPAAVDNDVPGDNDTKQLTQVLDESNEWRTVAWSRVRAGHIVRIATKEKAPADIVLVRTGTANNDCYIQTNCFDGDQKLRLRRAAPISKEIFRFVGDGARKGSDLQAFAIKQLREQLRFTVSVPVKRVGKFYGVWVKDQNRGTEKLDLDNFMPRNGLLLLTDYVIGVVVYTGHDTKYALIGAQTGARARELKRLEKAEKEKEKNKQKAEERKKKAKAEEIPRDVRIATFEQQTGMKWRDTFTDVPDDGNCLITAFWLGLTTLLRYYPKFRLPEEKDLPANAALFRTQLFEKLKTDKQYVDSIRGMLQLYVEQLSEDYLISMEDFFVLPESIRTQILSTKAALYQNAGGVAASGGLNYDEMVTTYISAMADGTRNGGRLTYVPLGAQELGSLCRLYHVRLQTMSTASLFKSLNAVTVDECDPRTVLPSDIHEFDKSQTRLVRLLNIKSNHYNVHLPLDPNEAADVAPSAAAAAGKGAGNPFSSFNYWSNDYNP